jgi:glucose-1-phosphate thymidylyltransferase
MKKKLSVTIDEKLLKEVDKIIDLIYIRNRSQAIEHLVRSSIGESKTAVVLAGGKEGSQKISRDEYRMTASVKGKAIVERAIRKLRQGGFKEIYIVAGHKILTKIFDLLKDGSAHNVKINYVEEKEPFGNARSTLKLLRGKLNDTFLVVYGDIVFDKVNIDELWSQHIASNALATLMLTTSAKPSEKGAVKMQGNKILEFAQKPKRSEDHLVFSPIFVAEPEFLDVEGESLEYDMFPSLAKQGLLQGHVSPVREIHIHHRNDLKKI